MRKVSAKTRKGGTARTGSQESKMKRQGKLSKGRTDRRKRGQNAPMMLKLSLLEGAWKIDLRLKEKRKQKGEPNAA